MKLRHLLLALPAVLLAVGAIAGTTVISTWTPGSGISCDASNVCTSSGGASGANPTATASDTAVNGSASTFLRSDGAPAIQKASSSLFGVVKVDGTTITETGGVISATSGSGTVTSITAGTNITITEGSPCTTTCTVNSTASVGSTIIPPQGRLTLVTGTPVMTSDQTAKSQVFYDCYNGGSLVPYYTGSADALDTITSCEVSLTMATSGTGVTNSLGVFDVWYEGNTNHNICVATNGSGGGWASDTGGSNTARGTGYTQLDKTTRPYITNANSITHCYNGTTDYGTITANKATFIGSLYTTAAGQTGMMYRPAAASGGTANVLGLYNAYNQVPTVSLVRDNQGGSASHTYNSATWRSYANNDAYRVTWVDGLGQSQAAARMFTGAICSTTSCTTTIGIDFDSNSAAPGTIGMTNDTNPVEISAEDNTIGIGLHFAQGVESVSNPNTGTYYATINGSVANGLTVQLPM